jgi:hypothetical protein
MMTKSEREFQAKVRAFGCVACKLKLGENSMAEIHHMLKNGKRRGEMFVLPLCPTHHRGGFDGRKTERNPMCIVSRDHSQRRFEKYVGMTEDQMLDYVKDRI